MFRAAALEDVICETLDPSPLRLPRRPNSSFAKRRVLFFTVAPSEAPQRNFRCGACCLWWYTPSSSTKCSCRNSFDTYHSLVAVKDRAEPTATCCEREPVVFTADVPGCVRRVVVLRVCVAVPCLLRRTGHDNLGKGSPVRNSSDKGVTEVLDHLKTFVEAARVCCNISPTLATRRLMKMLRRVARPTRS